MLVIHLETLVPSHVMLNMNYMVVLLGAVRMMEPGVVLKCCVHQVLYIDMLKCYQHFVQTRVAT